MPTRLRWKRLPNGSHMSREYPIVIERSGRDAPVLVKTPLHPTGLGRDGWAWSAVVDTVLTGTAQFGNVPDAKAWVADNLDMIAGQTDPEHGPDMSRYEAWAEHDAALSARIKREYGAAETARRRSRPLTRTVDPAIAASDRIYKQPITDAEQALAEQLAALPRERQTRVVSLANDLRKKG